MTNNLKWLIWCAFLILAFNQVLEWNDSLDKLQTEAKRAQKFRDNEYSKLKNVNWQKIENDAKKAQLAWLERLPSVEQTGLFRARAMESLKEICEFYKATCKISAQGEVFGGNFNNDKNVLENNKIKIPGIFYSNFRISIPINFENTDYFIKNIENDKELRIIERFTVRGPIIDIYIRSYGIEQRIKSKFLDNENSKTEVNYEKQ